MSTPILRILEPGYDWPDADQLEQIAQWVFEGHSNRAIQIRFKQMYDGQIAEKSVAILRKHLRKEVGELLSRAWREVVYEGYASKLKRVQELDRQISIATEQIDDIRNWQNLAKDDGTVTVTGAALRAISQAQNTIVRLMSEVREEIGAYDPATRAMVEEEDPLVHFLQELTDVRREATDGSDKGDKSRDRALALSS